MLATIALLAMSLSGLHAQSNSEYNFLPPPSTQIDGDSWNSAPVPILSMDCLGANGVGQWTLSSGNNGIYTPGWYLLENALRKPSTTAAAGGVGCIPPGVVAFGALSGAYPTEPKLTANLDEGTNYVWPEPTLRQTFVLQGFGPGFSSSDIDISLTGIPNPAITRQIVKNTIHTVAIPTWTGTPVNTHDIVVEADYRDEFDVTSDAAYTYFVWASTINPVHPGKKEIWVTAVRLGTSTPAPGFPMFVGDGERPTIACDPRHNRTGTPTPFFDLAYETGHAAGAIIQWEHYNGVSFVSLAASNIFINPVSGAVVPYLYPLHVRAEVSSVAGGPWHSALFAIVYANGPTLIMFNPDNPNIPVSIAAYVDGALLNTSLPDPIHTGVGPLYVVDLPITAFANPYDNQTSWYQYDQFHCMYQVDAVDMGGTHWHPFLIVRGSDIGGAFLVSPDPTNPDTRLVINQIQTPPFGHLLPDPSTSSNGIPNYVGAVNQMGIHVHWRTGGVGAGTHFYARDAGDLSGTRPKRTFDEDIDENTLVTGTCEVNDGTSHGGTVGARVKGGYRLTVWSDPNYGYSATDIDAGFYQPPVTGFATTPGTLSFYGDNVTLLVGDGNSPATLAVMPNFQFLFDRPGPSDLSNEGVTVEGGSTFDFYGLNATRDATGAIVSLVPQFTDTPGEADGSGTISLLGTSSNPANLIVHGGADFHIFRDGLFTSGNHASNETATISVAYEPNIYPITPTGTANSSTSGIMTFEGLATIQNTATTGHFPPYVWAGSPAQNYIIHVPAVEQDDGALESISQYLSSYSSYQNAPSSGLSEIRFDGDYVNPIGGAIIDYLNCSFDFDTLNSMEITAVNPQNSFDVTNSIFSGTSEKAISIVHSYLNSSGTYGYMNIAGNTFNDATSTATADVFIELFYQQPMSQVSVSDNILVAGFHDPDVPFIGIDFRQTDGAITGNSLSGGFYEGIRDYGNSSNYDPTFICSNIVTNASAYAPYYGIASEYYRGYAKLNSLYDNSVGYWQLYGGIPHLVANSIHDNVSTGIQGDGTIDMSGVHHNGILPGTGDIAGYNSVYNNHTAGSGNPAEIAMSTTSSYPYNDLFVTQEVGSSWTVAGLNNIYQGGSSIVTALVQGDANSTNTLDISGNYWGSGIDPSVAGFHYPNATYWPGYHYGATAGASAQSSTSGIGCGGGYLAKDKGKLPEGAQSYDTCLQAIALSEQWGSFSENDLAYDTIRWYIMHCYPAADPGRTFNALRGCAASSTPLSTSLGGAQYVRWLLDTVIELRPDDGWFCSCVEALIPGYEHNGNNMRAELTILKFLIDNPRCSDRRNEFGSAYANERQVQFSLWGDTAKNNNIKNFDSTLPSMHDLGLDTLLNFASVHYYEASGPQIITDASITANPFQGETSLSLSTNREAYLHIDVLDLLGRKIEGAGYEGVFEPGSRTIPLNMASVSSGTYYVRISTANNELRTLKLVKKE